MRLQTHKRWLELIQMEEKEIVTEFTKKNHKIGELSEILWRKKSLSNMWLVKS